MATILITGGAGYIGSHCAKALAEVGHRGVVFDNLTTGHREFVRWGPLIEADVRDGAALDAVFRAYAVDAVVHLAAVASVAESVERPGLYYDVNVNGTRVLLDAMVRAAVGLCVFSSSCAVYGQPAGIPIAEDTALQPINPYGFSKLACERMLGDFGRAHGLKSIRLRYFNAAGADPDAVIGERHDPETHLIPRVLERALDARPAFSMLGTDYPTPDGTAVRDYVHVSDLARAHVLAVDDLLKGGATAAMNLGTGRGVSVREVLDTVQAITGCAITAQSAPRRPGDPATLVASPALAAKRLGWRATRSDLTAIVADAWRWHKSEHERMRGMATKQAEVPASAK